MGERKRKGEVAVVSERGRLLLRWSCGGKRYRFFPELSDDNPLNWKIAESKARIIEGDIATGNFDPSLDKYKVRVATHLSAAELFEQYMKARSRELEKTTLDKYRALHNQIKKVLPKAEAELKHREADRLKDWLLEQQEPVTVRDRITILSACWRWAIDTGKADSNPWENIRIRVQGKSPNPFTSEEVSKIVAAFESSQDYRYYAPYVKFLLATGCRTGEVIGLRWRNVAEDCSVVHIVEAIRRSGEVKDTKNHRIRDLALSPGLRAMLLKHRPKDYKPDGLVFPAPKGGKINDNNFCKRAWTKCLETAGVKYRKPYNSRHTALSHAIARGVSPAQVAEMAGDRLETVIRNYVGNVSGIPETIDY